MRYYCSNKDCKGYESHELTYCEIVSGNGSEEDAMLCDTCEEVTTTDDLYDIETYEEI